MEANNYTIIANQFAKNIRFKELCIQLLSRFYPFKRDQIIKYRNVLDFDYYSFMSNENIKWDLELVDLLKDHIDWSGFWKSQEIELDLNFFEKFKEYIDFSFIHLNKNIDWSNQLLDTYQNQWNWKSMSSHKIVANQRNIKLYKNRLDWNILSLNKHLAIDDMLLLKFKSKWDWKKLCANPAIKFNKNEISRYYNLIDWNSLSRNPSMVPFILAYTDQYPWNWFSFAQNPGVVFGDKTIQFLLKKLRPSSPNIKSLSEQLITNFTKKALFKLVSCRNSLDRDVWFGEAFQNIIPWKELINRNPNILTTQEIEKHLCLKDFDRILPNQVVKKLSNVYIEKNYNSLESFSWSIFRYGNINELFVKNHAGEREWYQLAFNEQFDWSLDFLVSNFERFETIYGLKQNKKIYNVLFVNYKSEHIESLLNKY